MWGTDSLKRPWCCERLKAGGGGNDRGRVDWMAWLTQWTWVWASSGSWWWTGKPGVLQSMGSQRVRYNWATELKWTASWKESYDKPTQCIKKQRHHFVDKGSHSQNYDFSSSHVQMWEPQHSKDWVSKNWCFWTVVLEKTFESPLHSKKIKPANP